MMDQYIIIITQNHFWQPITSDGFSQPICGDLSNEEMLPTLNHKKCKKWIAIFNEDDHPPLHDVTWQSWNESVSPVSLAFSQFSTALLNLAEMLPPPGSYVLDIYWYLKPYTCDESKDLSLFLGALKKLKLWHLAEIHFVHDFELLDESATKLAAAFVSGKLIHLSKNCIFWREKIVWRGCIDATEPDSMTFNLAPGFIMCRQKFVKPVVTALPNSSCSCKVNECNLNIWFGTTMKMLNLVDASSVPLFYLTEHEYSLTCSTENLCGKTLKSALLKNKNSSFLCKLDFISTTNGFMPCLELSTQRWKDVVLSNPAELNGATFKLDYNVQHVYFLITLPNVVHPKDVKESISPQMEFHMQALHSLDDLNVATLLKQCEKLAYQDYSIPVDEHNSAIFWNIGCNLLFQHRGQYWNFMNLVAKNWCQLERVDLTQDTCLRLIKESLAFFNLLFEMEFDRSSEIMEGSINPLINLCRSKGVLLPELEALQNKEKFCYTNKSLKTIDLAADVIGSDQSVLKVVSSVDAPFNPNHMEKLVDKQQCSKILASLASMKKVNTTIPQMDMLQDFHTAIATSYHGINFNVDARASERADRLCRRTAEKLVKYETFSIGSKCHVPSPSTMNADDSPNKYISKRSCKQKKLQSMADKLYHKNMHKKVPQKSLMLLRSTPTKTNKIVNKANSVVSSPSTHKMNLRSSLPINDVCKLSKAKKDSGMSVSMHSKTNLDQKLYVQQNKKQLHELVIVTLAKYGICKGHKKYSKCVKRLYDVSMAFLKDLKSSKRLVEKMEQTVQENVGLVLSFENTSTSAENFCGLSMKRNNVH